MNVTTKEPYKAGMMKIITIIQNTPAWPEASSWQANNIWFGIKKTWGCKVLCLLLNRHPQATPCEGQVTQKAELLSISHYPCDRVATQGTRPILTFHTGARPSKNFYPTGYFHIHLCKAPQTVAPKTRYWNYEILHSPFFFGKRAYFWLTIFKWQASSRGGIFQV